VGALVGRRTFQPVWTRGARRERASCDTRPAMVQPTVDEPSLQQRYAPAGRCFGCGPANPAGLHIQSRPDPNEASVLVADFVPRREHEAFDGVVNGGILGTLADCHMNWTAASALMRARGLDRPPTTVTLEYAIRMRRPTPSDRPIQLRARVTSTAEDRATVAAEVLSDGELTATATGTFVAVKPDHPAYNRW
jgi:acyl-coenzyme A thioesterase PaaI-like protein